ncbi:MAG: hypothetical protein HRT69_01125 [Flavobacteriaceae bacterium]|nr:hypothetical protein [Flavobacteriaceae bacterium]
MSNVSKVYRELVLNRFVVVLLLLIISTKLFSQGTDIKFTHISVDEGLSHLVANFIDQDSNGFIWIGTDDGLNRFDGYDFKVYRSSPDDINSLSDNIITSFYQDKNDDIWIGTFEGLNRMSHANDSITRYISDIKDDSSLSNNMVLSITKDVNGFLWVGTSHGLNKFNIKTGEFKRFISVTNQNFGFLDDEVYRLFIDRQNNLWIHTSISVYKMNIETEIFQKIISLKKSNKVFSHNSFGFSQDVDNDILIGTNEGLFVYSGDDKEIKQYTHDSNNSSSISSDLVTDIIRDSEGVFWVGTRNGLNVFDRKTGEFYSYKQNFANSKSLSNDIVLSIFQDKSGAVWLGTYGGGVNRFSPFSKNFNYYKTPDKHISNSNDKNIWAILEDRNKNIWWGTNHGVYVMNESTNETRYFGVEEIKGKGIVQEFAGALIEDSKGNIWIGTDGGISILERKYVDQIFDNEIDVNFIHINEELRVLNFYEDVVKNKMFVGVFYEGLIEFDMDNLLKVGKWEPKYVLKEYDEFKNEKINIAHVLKKDSILWLGSQNGLVKLNTEINTVKRYRYQQGGAKTVSHNKVYCIQSGEKDILWLATYGGGLNRFNIATNKFKYYTTNDGLLNNVVYNLLVDNENKLWLSTNKGLSCFDPEKEVFRNYDENDGVQGNEFNQGAFYLSKTGRMYFGGSDGFNAFYPDKVDGSQISPEVMLTSFSIFNTAIKPNKSFFELGISDSPRVVLEKDINEVKNIKLSYKQSVFSIEFAASHYLNPKRNTFEYKLEGFDEKWVLVDSKNRKATYTNLDPGKYVFKVRAANKDGVWNQVIRELEVEISPPFWATNWFYFLSALVFLALVFVVLKIRIGQINLQHFKAQNELKTTMLKEIHHRVKNNLQIVNSLLRMQSSTMNDLKTVEVFKKVQSRIMLMASLHEEMYKTDNLSEIDTKKHFEKMITDLVMAYELDKEIGLKLDIDPVQFNMDTLIPLGLVVNELVVNSLKHAFIGREKGLITVLLKKTKLEKEYRLQVSDDGIGIKVDVDVRNMGSKLINSFVRQLKGTVNRLDGEGTIYEIKFKAL